jgi:hypothetical protein
MYLSNRYSVPLGTYTKHKKVYIAAKGNELEIKDRAGETLAKHRIDKGVGKLIKHKDHRRRREEINNEHLERTISLLGSEFRVYLTKLCDEKPRYVKDQLGIVVQACENYGREAALEVIEYCHRQELYSANDLNDALKTMHVPLGAPQNRLPLADERYHIPVQKRELSVYGNVADERKAKRVRNESPA